MISFRNDYGFGAHHSVLAHLAAINPYAHAGYGADSRCAAAAETIRDMFHAPEADVHFIPGGTLANLTVIAAMLRPHQGAISADTGHINVHETGAVEATGHKVLAVPHACGKVAPADVARRWMPTGRTKPWSIRCSPAWCTSQHHRAGHRVHGTSWRCPLFAGSTACPLL